MDSTLQTKLDTLQLYLSNLPESLHLPEPTRATYPFDLFEITPEDIEDYGETGAVNRELEIAFGTRRDGPIVFVERGPVLVQVVDILQIYLQKDPTSAILQKWVDDLTTSAELCFSRNNIPLPTAPRQLTESTGTFRGPPTVPAVATTSKKSSRSVQKLDSKKLSDTNDPAYEDIPEAEDHRKGGAKLLPLLSKVSIHCRSEERARCIGSRLCHTSWKWPRARQRILEHASKCGYIDAKLRDAAVVELARKAVGPAIVIPDGQQADYDRPRKSDCQAAATGTITSSKLSTAATSTASQKMMESFQVEGKKVSKENGDYAVMKFFVCCGIPPSIVDTKEFKEMVAVLSGQRGYTPPSSTKLEKSLVVNEAAKISLAVLTHLQNSRNLTITFDGGKIRKPKSLYTIHVTTADHRAFCMDLDDASLLSHSADYILEALERVIDKIGPWNFSATSSDNAGNTRKARENLCKRYPHILNFQDPCHLLNLAIKAICLLKEFQEVTTSLRQILAFMSKSSYAMEHFDYERTKLGITRGLEGIGNTRFATMYWAGKSVQRGLPALQAIVENESLGIDIAALNHLFVPGGERLTFELEMSKLLSVIGPYAKAIQCLEGGDVSPDRVYYYWLGIVAQLDSLFKMNAFRLRSTTIEDIRAITNARFAEMITNAPNDIYISAFFLNPEYRTAPIYKKINPLAIPTTLIRQKDGATTSQAKPIDDIVQRIGLSLLKILKNEYGDVYENPATREIAQSVMTRRNPLLAETPPLVAIKTLKTQLNAYNQGYPPFDRPFQSKDMSPYTWWEHVQRHEDGAILGALSMKIFASAPTSMVDERTMSMISWLNSPRRSRQEVGTLQDHVKIRQWHRGLKDENKKFKATLKWREVEATLGKRSLDEVDGEDSESVVSSNIRLAPRARRMDSEVASIDAYGALDHPDTLDDGNAWLDAPRHQLDPDAVGAERTMFTLGGRSDINITSPFLRDILSDADILQKRRDAGMASKEKAPGMATPVSNAPPASSDWETW